MKFLKIAWLQNNILGMDGKDRIIYQDPQNRYIYYNVNHPDNQTLEFDGVLIYNHAQKESVLSVPKGRIVMVHNEPAYAHLGWNEFMYDQQSVSQADVLFTCVPNTYSTSTYYPYCLLNYDWKKITSYPLELLEQKTKTLSCVSSSKTISVRHAQRAIFTEYLALNMKECDLYGRERNLIPHLLYGLKDYHYSIAIENTTEKNFFTEKILSCFYALTVPFYDGCMNLEDFFPEEAFVRIDITKPQETRDIIKSVLSDPDDYQRRLPALKKARCIFLENFELFEVCYQKIQKLIKQTPYAPVEKTVILPPKIETVDHDIQLKEGYFYAKLGYPYISKGKNVPEFILEQAKATAKSYIGTIHHSFLVNK